MCERIFWQSTLKVLQSSQVEFLRVEGYNQLGEDEKEVLTCRNRAAASLRHNQWLFLPASAEFAWVECDRGASHRCSTAVSTDSKNNLVHWSEKICQASKQHARRAAGIVVESFATEIIDDLVLNVASRSTFSTRVARFVVSSTSRRCANGWLISGQVATLRAVEHSRGS